MIEGLSRAFGIAEPAIRLMFTLFSAYGLAALYRTQIRHFTPTIQHWYFILTGLALMYFNYGWDIYHSIIAVVICYLLCKFLGGTSISVVLAFVIYMAYLFVGFWYIATDEYDMSWTLPQCILTLRLIATVTDLYDGRTIKPEKRDENMKETALDECPSLLEIAAQTYFYSSFLVGPQFALKRFRSMVNGDFEPPTITEKESTERMMTGIGRLCLGLCYLLCHVLIYPLLPSEYFVTDQFKEHYFICKFFMTLIWLRAIMFRYQAAWLVAEGSCILSGLAYNGRDKNGRVKWDAVRNIRMVKFEFGCSFQSVIESFNYNTNLWAAKYVFKRLRFLGNKTASHILTLLFLSLWHGFHSGYYFCFGFEFVCVYVEKLSSTYFAKNHRFQTLARTPEFLLPIWVVEKLFILGGCGFGFLPFTLLTYELWMESHKALRFYGWIGIVVVLAIDKFIWKNKKSDFGIMRHLV